MIGLIIVFGCSPKPDHTASILEIPVPCEEGGEANLFVSESELAYLSWVEYLDDSTDALVFSTLENSSWSAPKTIAKGSDWFVNWADFPSLVAYQDDGKSLAAHWLQKSASGTYDYDVHISQSSDGGQSWRSSFIPHRDSIAAEHGFVSMLPLSGNQMFATWLDGRNTKGEGSAEGEHGHHGAMSLRAAVFDKEGRLSEEAELDNKVCDCCQTSAALTEQGVIVAYRGRSDDEIRDIEVVRQVNGKWSKPKIVFPDNWEIAGCPVNGPSIQALRSMVAIAWYTEAGSNPMVKVAFSLDDGAIFDEPIRIDSGHPLGRVDIELLSSDKAIVSWIEKKEKDASIMVVSVGSDGKKGPVRLVATISPTRQSGFPIMEKIGNNILFAWTQVDSVTRIKSGLIPINEI